MNNWLQHYSVPLVLLVAWTLSAASYFLPLPAGTPHETATHWRMVSTVAMATHFAGAALLFLQGLSAFKAGLRIAYRWFAVGMIVFAAAFLQWPFLVMLDAENSFWVISGIVVLPYIVSVIFMYKGMRLFAKLLEIRSWLLSWPTTLTIVAIFAVISGAAAYIYLTTIGPEAVSDDTYMFTATVAWSTGFGIFTWLIARKVRATIGASYQKPMGWLVLALGFLCLSAIHEYVTSFFVSTQDWYLYSGAITWLFNTTGVIFVVAGYMFNAKSTGVSAMVERDEVHSKADINRAYIDSITNVAQLVSQPTDIDPILDGLRHVTAGLQPDTPLSPDERMQLVDVYKQLETYLVTSDPLRTFTKEELRPLLAPEFRSQVEGQAQTA